MTPDPEGPHPATGDTPEQEETDLLAKIHRELDAEDARVDQLMKRYGIAT